MSTTSHYWGEYPILGPTEYKEVFENISACLFVVDVTPDGRFRFVGFNRAEEEAVGFSNAQVAGRFVEDLFTADLAQQLIGSYRQAVNSGVPIHFDSDLDLPAGQRSFHTNLIPLKNDEGRIHRIAGACIDITDFKRAKEEAMARQRMDSLGLLAGGVAHDFGNLVTGVLAEADAARSTLDKDSPAMQSILNIRQLAAQAGEIVRVLMAYAGKESPVLEQLDFSSLAKEALEAVRATLARNITLTTNLPPNLPPVRGNPAQLRQVILNLLANAREALGGRKGFVSIDVSADHPYVRMQVSDSGCGMTQEVRARIFDPFFTTKSTGRGLGLASVLGIVQAHGGRIEVTSVPGQGSGFVLLLPAIATVSPVQRDTSSSHETKEQSAGTILLVEDEQLLRHTLAKMLRQKGLNVTEAADGRIALTLFQNDPSKFDVVLLDLTLPITPGATVLSEMLRIRPDVKLIITTAHSEKRALAQIGIPGLPVLSKPYEIVKLYELIKSLLRKHGAGG